MLGRLLVAKGDLAAAEPLCREALKGLVLNRLLNAKQVKLRPAEKLCGAARRWICGATRSAVGVRARVAPQGASVAPAPSVGCS